MNSPEFRLLAIWQDVVAMRNVRFKMLAYRKIAKRVGITERNVRENIKKLVEQGYLVPKDRWFTFNFDHEFIKIMVRDYANEEHKDTPPNNNNFISFQIFPSPSHTPKNEVEEPKIIEQPEEPVNEVCESIMEYRPIDKNAPKRFMNPSYEIEFTEESIEKFKQTFGDEAEDAMNFYKKKRKLVELELLNALRYCWSYFNTNPIKDHVANDVIYTSKWLDGQLDGAEEVLAYLDKFLKKVKEIYGYRRFSDLNEKIGYFEHQEQLDEIFGNCKPCLVIAQKEGDEFFKFVINIEHQDGKITRIMVSEYPK